MRRCLYISNQSTQYILPQQNYKYVFLSKKQIKSFLVVLTTMATADCHYTNASFLLLRNKLSVIYIQSMSDDTMHKANMQEICGGVALSSCGGGNFLIINNERIRRCLADEWFSYTAVTHRRRGKLLEHQMNERLRRYLAGSWFYYLERPVLLLLGELPSPLWCCIGLKP